MALFLAAVLATATLPARGQDKQDPKESRTAEEMRREALQKGLEAQLKGDQIRVTIVLKNATVQEGVDQFRRQVSGQNFVGNYDNFPEEYRIDEFIVKDMPWRDAFDAFLAKTQMMLDEEKPGYLRFSRPARVTFALKDADIKSVVDLIARISRANIVLAPNVQGKITLSVNDVPWNVVLETVVRTLGNYTVVRERFDILRIVHENELKKQMEQRLFRLTYLTPPASYKAKFVPNNQVIGSTPQAANTIAEAVKQFTLIDLIKSMLTRAGDGATGAVLGRVDYDINSNSLAVTDTKVVLDKVEEVIKVLDVEPDQVIVDVKFISTTNDDLLTFGINYASGGEDGITLSTRPLAPIPPYSAAGASGLGVGQVTRLPWGLGSEIQGADTFFFTNYEVVATFRAFKRDRFSKLIQEPSLSILNNTEATIFVGETISYAESRAQTNQFGGLEFTIAEGGKSPVKVGFQLMVIPRILRKENRVLMTVIPQNEFLTGTSPDAAVAGFEHFELQGLGANGSTVSIDLPRIASSTLLTRLMVENGRTAVLGGLVTERITYEDKKIPILGDIPLINPLFKQRSDSVRREHLLVFITPRIVRGAAESEKALRAQLRELEDLEKKRLDEMRLNKVREDLRKQEEEKYQKALEEQRKLERK
jgi:type II secretory pathway component GspD/PulD (secretin)